MSYSTQTKEQSYELSLTSTLAFNIVFSGIVFILFPLGRRYAPAIFAPQQHLEHYNTGVGGYLFWFIDVFQQPLAVYSTRGNLATIFAVFQMLLLTLYAFIAFISLTILIPVYWYGTDQNWNANYLTYWSKITLPHLERSSIMILVPYIVVIVITVATMFFYHQFTLLYVFFRQRCLKRVTAQNYMVLLQNIPSVLDTARKTQELILPMMRGVKATIAVPKQCNQLTKLSVDLDSLNLQLEKMRRYVCASTVQQQYAKLFIKNNSELLTSKIQQYDNLKNQIQELKQVDQQVLNQLKEINKEIIKLNKNNKQLKIQFDKKEELKNKCQDGFGKLILEINFKIQEIRKIMYLDNIEEQHLDKLKRYPPQMPEIILKSFDLIPDKQQIQPNTLYDKSIFVANLSKLKLFNQQKKIFSLRNNHREYQNIGSSVFLFCDSQSIASEKYTALIASDSKQPEALLAPNPNEIVWKYMAISNTQKFIRKLIFIVVLAGLFIGYLWGQTKLLGIIKNSSQEWQISIFYGICPSRCTYGTIQIGYCVVCDGFSRMLVTMVPTLFNCILMAFLPLFINWAVKLLCYPSISKNVDLEYQLLFVFLIIIVGIIQVTLPDMIDVKSGSFSLAGLKDLDITTLVDTLGHNVASQQFTFINYIVNKYCTFPVFGLLNIGGIINWILAHGQKNSLDFNLKLRFSKFNFNKQLAYTAHMFVVGFIFAIVAPITNVIIFVTYLLFVTIDRYFILYINTPTVTSDLSSQANMLVNVIGTISIGLIFMLIATGCYFFIQSGPLANLGAAVCVICLILSIIFKQSVDKRYQRALSTLTKGTYETSGQLYINPVNKYQWYYNEDEFPYTQFNIKNHKEKERLNKLIKYDEQSKIKQNKQDGSSENIINKKKIQIDKSHTYKQNYFDKLLGKIHVDLTVLPVSQVIVDDHKLGEVRCKVLSDDQMIDTVFSSSKSNQTKNMQDYTEEDVNFMACYTHPAILQQVNTLMK
ncbi:Transmembrane_domain-containing protein [Hexamita inflata]|uniref:Transmembrane_domain-containing protein n=1 Tax=Hexamita inflata TaxID=28002 RepID=A0ABP1LPS4_9EUKA